MPSFFLTVLSTVRNRLLEVLEIVKYLRIHRIKQLKQCRPKRLAESQETLSLYAGRDDSSISNEPLQEKSFLFQYVMRAPGGTSYNGLYGDFLSERGNLLRLEVYKKVGILRVEV